MTDRVTRREFIVRSAALAAAATVLPLVRPSISLAGGQVHAESLSEAGEAFRRGAVRGVAVVPGPRGPVLQATRDGGVYTSGVLQSSTPFTHVGLHWLADVRPPAHLDFALRTSPDGLAWSTWSEVELERAPRENPTGDYFAALAYAPGDRFVQYRATFRTGGGASPTLERVTATVISSPAVATVGSPVTVTDAVSGRSLSVITREGWGADESLRFSGGKEVWPEMTVPSKKLVIHHTATRNTYTAAEAAAEVRAIYRYHAVDQGWGDGGYQAIVDKFGNVYELRHGRGGDGAGSREILSAGVVGGHDLYHNYGSSGVALLGNAVQGTWPMKSASGPMWNALVSYCVFEAGRHFIRPLKPGSITQANDNDTAPIAVSDFLRSDDLWANGMRNISGHKETNATACPGKPVTSLLDELRNAIHAVVADPIRTGVSLTDTKPGGRETKVGTLLAYSWRAEPPEGGWSLVEYEYCMEGWYKPPGSYDIEYLLGYTSETQPIPVWTPVSAATTNLTFTPRARGHYTFHIRAVLQKDGSTRRGAYEANHTFLVR